MMDQKTEQTTQQGLPDPMQVKLSEIFDYADKNLGHARIIYGSPTLHCACAVGAVAYVLSNGKTTYPSALRKIDLKLWERYKYLRKEFTKRDRFHLNLVLYNDYLFYSFKHLAEKCRKLGL